VAMVPTFVNRVPNGTEEGTFLAISIASTLLCVSEVTFDGANKSTQRDKIFQIPAEATATTAASFFDYIATSVDTFLKEYSIQLSAPTPIGFVFPFPVERTDLNKAKIVSWAKGFKIQDGPGQNVEKLLQEAFDRKKVNVTCAAIVNDTVALLLSESYGCPNANCHISAIFGLGTNGAYVEDAAKITKLDKRIMGQMLINTEWGAFKNKDILPLTQFDQILDQQSTRPGFHLFEKLVSWIFISELVRHILLSLEQKPPHLLKGIATTRLKNPGSFSTTCMTLIEEATTPSDIKKILADNPYNPVEIVTDEDAEIVRWVSQLVFGRAIKLSACAVAAIITQAGYTRDGTDQIPIALSGEIVYYYPQFENRLREVLKIILGESVAKRIAFLSVEDADTVGAALGVYEMERRR